MASFAGHRMDGLAVIHNATDCARLADLLSVVLDHRQRNRFEHSLECGAVFVC